MTVELAMLGRLIRKGLQGTEDAVIRAARRTAAIDAQRAIQWSIAGGGWGGRKSVGRKPPKGYHPPVDTGDYKNSWRSADLPDGARVYSSPNPAIKAGVIEKGRRPAFIPIEPLAQWVRRKFGIADEAEQRRIAWAISIKASKTPRPGLHVLERATPRIREAYQKNIERELRKKRG